MWPKLSKDIDDQLIKLVVAQAGEPEDGPVLLSNYYYNNDSVTKRLVYYVILEYSNKSINKFQIRDEAYDERGRLERGWALVLDVKDETCVIEETKAALNVVAALTGGRMEE